MKFLALFDYLISKIGYLFSAGLCGLPVIGCANTAELSLPPADPVPAIVVPSGFRVQVFARLGAAGMDYFRGPRFMAFGPDGNLYVSMGMDNKVLMLVDSNKDGVADQQVMVSDKLNAPQGLAFVDGKLLVANQDGVVRLESDNGKWPAISQKTLIRDLPSGGHTLKNIKLGPDGYLYINVGSSCNVCVESDPQRATILRYTTDGKPAGALLTLGRHAQSPVWARGLRNSQGFAWDSSDTMFATDNGADMRSDKKGGKPNDELPPEDLNRIEGGQHYGWPYCWGKQQPDPNFPGDDGFCSTTQPATIEFKAHSTPIGITFLNHSTFPESYKSSAIVALHGSWNREEPSGYKLVQVKFVQGRATEVVDFATGWMKDNVAWGRPVDVTVAPDGALYVTDDRAGFVYRISYNPDMYKPQVKGKGSK